MHVHRDIPNTCTRTHMYTTHVHTGAHNHTVYTCIHVYTRTHVRTEVYTHDHTRYTCAQVHTCVLTYTQPRIGTHVYQRTHTWTPVRRSGLTNLATNAGSLLLKGQASACHSLPAVPPRSSGQVCSRPGRTVRAKQNTKEIDVLSLCKNCDFVLFQGRLLYSPCISLFLFREDRG